MKKKIMVGMSGGVDSSVAAKLLCDEGHHVEGLFMKNWEEDDTATYCAAQKDLQDAQKVCDTLGIQLHQVNFSDEYWDNVFEYFLSEYKSGRTPNPDILCNKEIKFNAFLDHAKHLGMDYIATGHYASLETYGEKKVLCRAADNNKDQTYFLHALSQEQLKPALFPLGHLKKQYVRKIAEDNGFITHDKKDSTGICFIGERQFKTFLEKYLPAQPGNIETETGEVVGRHDGLMYYTIGQRKGIGIGGTAQYSELPWYVALKDLSRNVLVVVQGQEHPMLYRNALTAKQVNWIAGEPPRDTGNMTAKIRYRTPDHICRIDLRENGDCKVFFAENQWAVTPGQSIVFYQGDVCLGGGVIA